MRWSALALCAVMVLAVGCGSDQEKATKPTTKVFGVITINGEPPEKPVQIECIPEEGRDDSDPTISAAETQEDGSFEISTYVAGDGVPAGSYAIVAKSVEFDIMMRQPKGPDLLNGKYDEAQESPKKFEVNDGDEPLDLGTIELSAAKKK